MKKLILAVIALAGMACAGPSLGSWLPIGQSTPIYRITATGAYSPATSQALSNVMVNARGSSPTDTMTAYIADANGKIGTDLCTWIGTAAGYIQAGGSDAHLDFKGAWQLIVTKCVGSFTVTVDQ